MGTAQGAAYPHAVNPKVKPIVFWGVWIYFGPSGFGALWWAVDFIREFVISGSGAEIAAPALLVALFCVAYGVLSAWVLWSVTKGFLTNQPMPKRRLADTIQRIPIGVRRIIEYLILLAAGVTATLVLTGLTDSPWVYVEILVTCWIILFVTFLIHHICRIFVVGSFGGRFAKAMGLAILSTAIYIAGTCWMEGIVRPRGHTYL